MTKRGRPPIDPAERKVTLSLRVKPQTKADLETMADADGSMGNAVDRLVARERRRAARG